MSGERHLMLRSHGGVNATVCGKSASSKKKKQASTLVSAFLQNPHDHRSVEMPKHEHIESTNTLTRTNHGDCDGGVSVPLHLSHPALSRCRAVEMTCSRNSAIRNEESHENHGHVQQVQHHSGQTQG